MDFTGLLERLNRRIPRVSLETDFLSFFFQLVCLFGMVVFGIIISILGIDVTAQYLMSFVSSSIPPLGIGEGTHLVTLFTTLLVCFLVSTSLNKQGLFGFYAVVPATFISFAAMYVFEVPWVFFYDLFHTEERPWALTTYGKGYLDFEVALIGYMIPLAILYVTLLRRPSTFWEYIPFLGSLMFITVIAFPPLGTCTITLRNFANLSLFVFCDAMIRYGAYVNGWKIRYRFKSTAFSLLLTGFMLFGGWVLYPIFFSGICPYTVVKGAFFPQTIYAFYNQVTGLLQSSLYVPNVLINHLNFVSKFFIVLGVSLLVIPEVYGKEGVKI